MIDFLYNWQDLLGAIIGAATPILFWFLIKIIESHVQHKDNLYYLEKLLVTYINTLAETQRTILSFTDIKLNKLILDIDENTSRGSFSLNTAFYPLFSSAPIEDNLVKFKTGNPYMDNQLTRIHQMSRDFAACIDDSRRQFEHTFQTQKEVCYQKLNSPAVANTQYKENILEFKRVTKGEILEKNIKIYMKVLATTRVALHKFEEKGKLYWNKIMFAPNFKYFKNNKQYKIYLRDTYIRIEKYLEKDVENEYSKLLKDLEDYSTPKPSPSQA